MLGSNDGHGLLGSPDAEIASSVPRTLFGFFGDSNMVGIGDTDKADAAFLVTTANASVLFNSRYAVNTNNPPTWIDFTTNLTMRTLAPYAAGGVAGMGIEITLGPELLTAISQPAIAKFAETGTTLAQWLPTSTFPTGTNLYNLWVARMHAFEVSLGRKLGGVVISLGTNDANSSGDANAFQANMATIVAAIRAEFGSSTAIVWIKTNVSTSATFVSTVRSGQVAAVAADPTITLVDNDDLALVSDLLHYTANSYLTLGQRCAFALLDRLGYARQSVVTTPSVVGWGPAVLGSGDLSPISWGGARDGDLEYMVTYTGIAAGSITTPTGWTLVCNADSTGGGATEHGAIFSRAVTTAMLAANANHTALTTVVDTNAENVAKIFCVRGPNLNPTTDVSLATSSAVFNTGPVTINGVTTTVANDRVLIFSGGYSGGLASMAVTCAGLTSVAELQDGPYTMPDTNRQIVTLTTGVKAAAGATGTASATSSSNMTMVNMMVAVKP